MLLPELWKLILEKGFGRFETDGIDYYLLNRIKQVSRLILQIVGEMMLLTTRIPERIEQIIQTTQLLEKHPNIEHFTNESLSRALPHLKNLKHFHYVGTSHNYLQMYPISSTKIQTLSIANLTIVREPNLSIMKKKFASITSLTFNHYRANLPTGILLSFTNLTELNLNHCGDTRNEMIQPLTNLKTLLVSCAKWLDNNAFLFHTNLTSLNIGCCDQLSDEAISHLTGLQNLSLNGKITNQCLSKLTNLEILSIPNDSKVNIALQSLTNLKKLLFSSDLSDNEIFLPSLTSLDLSKSGVRVTGRLLPMLTNLKTLILKDGRFGHTEYPSIGRTLSRLTQLTSLSLRGSAVARNKWITNLTNLTFLDIFDTNITSSALVGLTRLQIISFPVNRNPISLELMKCLLNLTDIIIDRRSKEYFSFELPPQIYVTWY